VDAAETAGLTGAAAGEPAIEYLSPVAETPFPDDWYAFADASHFWMQWRLAVTLQLCERVSIPLDRPLDALDIGGGAGRFREQLESRTSWRVDMTDLNLPALRMSAPARGRTLYYDVTQAERPLAGRYDLCFLFDVIEHVPQPGTLVAAALAHLKPGGCLLVNVPALQSLFSAYDVAAGHIRRYSRRTLAADVSGPVARLEAIRYWGFTLVPLLALRRVVAGRKPDENTIRAGFEPPSKLAHAALKGIMRAELAVFRDPPLGTSVMAAVRRTSG
jgi:SAM-dependent methyltransferase